MDEQTKVELESAAFRTLIDHLKNRTDVQNKDLMNLAGFCRNCLSKWMVEAANSKDIPLDYEEARKHVYGMTYEEWKTNYQK